MPSIRPLLQATALVLFVCSVLATPLNSHVQHEKRASSSNSPWRRNGQVHSESIIPLRIGLVQSNLELGNSHLEAISHPGSPRYGQHLSAEEVHSLFAPTEDTVEAVRDWLLDSGIDRDTIVHSDNEGWFALDLPASSVEQLFKTSIHEYEHGDSGALRLGCEEYHVPTHLTEHIDYITPGVRLSAVVRKRSKVMDTGVGESLPSSIDRRNSDALPSSLLNCSNEITPECLRALYKLPNHPRLDQANAPAFFEQGDYWAQSDLNKFFRSFAPQIPIGTEPVVKLIDGAVASRPATSKQVSGEADGDIEIAFGLVYPTVPVVYQVDDPYYAKHEVAKDNLFNTFLDAVSPRVRNDAFASTDTRYSQLDGSYCNYVSTNGIHRTYSSPMHCL